MATRAFIELLRWLGPWAAPAASPPAVRRVEHTHGVTRVIGWRADTARPSGDGAAVVLVPGLHYAGPDDPRFDRFARILAHAGAHVLAPEVRAFRALSLAPEAVVDAEAALALARDEHGHDRVGVLSISFGSILALHLAARHPLHAVVLFGGYHRHDDALRFALAGDGARRGDPLNGPAVVMNLAPELLPPADVAPFSAAARDFCERTWGRAELKQHRRHAHAAWAVLADHALPPAARELFLQATGLAPGILPRAEAALAQAAERHAWLDPTPLIARVTAPVTLIHGRDDDVIPWSHSAALARALPNARAFITGLYGHTGHTGHTGAAGVRGSAIAALAQELSQEMKTMAGMLAALARLVA